MLPFGFIELPKAINSAKSQSFGRRVYLIEQQDRKFWLKLQLQSRHEHGSYHAYAQSFLNELNCYSQLHACERLDWKVLLNFSILNPEQHFQVHEAILAQALCVEDAPSLFATPIDQLQRCEILNRMHLSLEVLGNLHAYGYVHGDLKTEHFRISNQVAALIDFEQSSALELIHTMPNTATPRYMAPELFHAQVKSFASDIYALGMIWWVWLNQTRFQQKSYLDWAKFHCQHLDIQLPAQFEMFKEILLFMLMKNKDQRCSNIYQLKQVLRQID